tara:strand:- start:494 stop:823 length:330 start_codon:yes stop_codon:yes gene_type:complete
MSLLTSSSISNNHNLYFSKDELGKILNLYSMGVSRGEWKDYAIDFDKNNAFFYIFKHTLAGPDCVLSKYIEKKRKKIFYILISKNFNRKFESIDKLLTALSRKTFKVIN